MKRLFLFAVLATTFAITSCEKEDPAVFGCTDSTAENYDPNATDDDGSCTYSQTAQNLDVGVYFLESNMSVGGEMKVVINGDTSTIYAAPLFDDYNTAVTVQFALDGPNDVQFLNADTLFCSISQATVIENSEEALLEKNGNYVYYADEVINQSHIPGTCDTNNNCAEGEIFSGYWSDANSHMLVLEL